MTRRLRAALLFGAALLSVSTAILPARAQWYSQASRFAGVEPREPAHKGNPMTLERYVAPAK